MNVAVIGAGVSGLTAALLLGQKHNVTLFEREIRLGGHAHTVTVKVDGKTLPVDTGFIVYNNRNYPGLTRLFDRLGVATTTTEMSFSVHDSDTGFEYGGSSLGGLIGSPLNLLSGRWWSTVSGVARLGSTGKRAMESLPPGSTLADLRASGIVSARLFDDYLLPMAGSIWSAPKADTLAMPASFMLRFFDNHGMLDLRKRPQWRTVPGGSRVYVDALRHRLRATVVTGDPVTSIRREPGAGVVCTLASGHEQRFEHAVLACHSDEALRLLQDPSDAETSLLGAMPFQANHAVLHTDRSLLPTRRRCWAAWNYRTGRKGEEAAPLSVTYNLSILQHLNTSDPLCVTLNGNASIDPAKVLWRGTYHHPIYTLEGENARARWKEISGERGTHYCGAYWLHGFHEDGVQSALRVVRALGGGEL